MAPKMTVVWDRRNRGKNKQLCEAVWAGSESLPKNQGSAFPK